MAKRQRREGTMPASRRPGREERLERLANVFLDHYRAKRLETAVPLAREITERYPRTSFGWKALGTALMEAGEPQAAVVPLEQALALEPDNEEALTNLGKALQQLGRYEEAESRLDQALVQNPDNYQANMHLAGIHQQRGRHDQALGYYERSLESLPDALLARMRKATVLVEQRAYDRALAILEPLADEHPDAVGVLTNLANLYGTMGRFDEAEALYRHVIGLRPDAWLPLTNCYFTAHYNPRHGADYLYALGREWQRCYAPDTRPKRPETMRAPDRPLRLGLVSAGLKTHPVGQMILAALENLPKGQFELIAYSDSLTDDTTARRLKALMQEWREVPHTSSEALAGQVREDAIDILIDMTGHTAGSRLPMIVQEPAPLIVKWVGGLFNTTGVEAVDYLLSDAVETPEGVDDYYLEKLIRLPDDYICYTPPRHLTDEPSSLPAFENGHITLGCFNNPAKLNETLLENWAELMHQLPGSRLLLKGGQYTNADYCERLYRIMEDRGVDRERVLLEGPAPHKELVATYRRVDIALDPWPYSGGLTTCEALYMGVPVVTLPGPSFAGRHSASHLVNAGLPELVTGTWEEYRQRVVELACDLESLSRIRQHLREVLLQSPVCNGPRFARHFTDAMRAIWQRHCEGKEPAALTFEADGQARFKGEDAPVDIHYAEALEDDSTFQWQFEGKIIAVDNGGQLLESDVVRQLLQKEALELIAFDPSSQALDTSLKQHKGVHYYPNATLGDGQPGQLHACLDPRLSASLLPLEDEYQPEDIRKGRQVLTRLPLSTIALDRIDGLPSIDWLVLDDLNDATAILEHGSQALKDTLLLQVKVAFQPTHERQPNLAEIQHWASRNGFRFYRLHEPQHRSHLPDEVSEAQRQATELLSADVLFIPNHERIKTLDDSQRTKIAFLLHSVYGIQDMVYALLREVSQEKAEAFLTGEKLLGLPSGGGQPGSRVSTTSDLKRRKVFVVGFPKSGTSTIQKALEETGYSSAHWKVKDGFVGELMYKGMNEKSDPWYYLSSYDVITQADVCIPKKGVNYWPNLDFNVMEKVREKYPECLFLLNYRDPKETASSIARWGDFLERLKSVNVPGLKFRGYDDAGDLQSWIVQHLDKVRDRFKGDANFLEVDINDDGAPQVIGEALGVDLAWWGVANKNKANRGVDLPVAPHMSSSERQLFRKSLDKAERYFEFGSGGSTVWAVQSGLVVHGVESDDKWVFALKEKLGEGCQVESVDIGPTKEWGFPVSKARSEKFPEYSQAIFRHQKSFDLVLVDGRFRVACTMAAIEHLLLHPSVGRERYIFIHDFWNRSHYHVVLEFLEVLESVDSAGVFRVKKGVELEAVREVWGQYADQPA